MMRKRLKGEDDTELDEGEEGKSKKGSSKKSKGNKNVCYIATILKYVCVVFAFRIKNIRYG